MKNLPNANTPIESHADNKSENINALYNREILMGVAAETIYDTFAQAVRLETNGNSKKLFARRYKELLPALVPLAEYAGNVTKNPDDVQVEEVELELKKYGAYIVVTEENELFNLDKIKKKYLKLQKNQAKRTSEEIIKDKVYNGLNVVYANGATSSAEAKTRRITSDDLNNVINSLDQQGAEVLTEAITGTTKVHTEPIESGYIGIVHHSMYYDLKQLDGWRDAIDYSSQERMKNEIGSYGRIRFIEDREGRTVENGAVLQGIIFGADAFSTLTLKGSRNLSTLIMDKTKVGGPLQEFSTIGWKFFQGAGILNQNWIVRIESGTSFVQDEKAYFAN